MNLTIELPNHIAAELAAEARTKGVSAALDASQLIENTFSSRQEQEPADQPFETGFGMWKDLGVSLSAEEIDENSRELFHRFAHD